MKVIFLDIDGVLNFYKSKRLDARCLYLLKYIIRRTGASLVLSSSWKVSVLYPQCCAAQDNRFVDCLMNHSGLKFTGVTPDISESHREIEIQQWMRTASDKIESFVIIDDLEFGFRQIFPNNFVQTSGFLKRGLTLRQALRAIKILNRVDGSQQLF